MIRALGERQAQHKSLQAQRILEEDLSLRTAVLKYLGSFEEVHRIFGIQPPRESPWRRASKTAIIGELRRRNRAEQPLSWKKILPQKHGSALLNRAVQLYGSWTAALRAAGLDPFHGRRSRWADADEGAILAEIRLRKRVGASLGYHALCAEKFGQPLVNRAGKLFGSWRKASLCAGIEPERGRSQWADATRAQIVGEIRRRKRAGESLISSHVAKEKHGRALQNRIAVLFGTWNAGLRAAGIEPMKQNSGWRSAGRAAIVAEIRRRHRRGGPLATRKVERTKGGGVLIKRAKSFYGSWAGALLGAGVDLPPGLMSPWPKADKAAILAEIRWRKRVGETLRVAEIERQTWGGRC